MLEFGGVSIDFYREGATAEGLCSLSPVMPHQVHSAAVAVVDRPGLTRDDLEGYDALITRLEDCPIAVRTADCVPVLLFDPVRRVVAAVHSGWKGTVQKIPQVTVARMMDEFGCSAEDLLAWIGPAIGPDSFQVGEEVVERFREAGFPMDEIYSWKGEPGERPMSGGHHLDLWRANAWLLENIGVLSGNINVSCVDTYTDESWFSARRQGIGCGRNINAIMLQSMRYIVETSSDVTPFQRRVYCELLKVPAGETISYRELGRRVGCRSAQAIGQALRRNPFAVGCTMPVNGKGGPLVTFTSDFCVPCHRVLASDGTLGGFHGQRTGPQIERKRCLLEEEQAVSVK